MLYPPPLVKGGETLSQIDETSFYMDNRSSINAIAISRDGKSIISGSYDNSIKIWNRVTGKLEKEFWGGVNGCWQVNDFEKNKTFRGDDGTFLLKKRWTWVDKERKNGVSEISSAYPSDYNLSKEDDLDLNIVDRKREILSGGSMELKLNIQNRGDNAYFMLVQGESEYLTVEAQRVDKIEKGESREVVLKVYAKLPRKNPKPLLDELNISVVTGNGSRFTKVVPISIAYVNVMVRSAEVSEDGKTLNVKVENSGNESLQKAEVKLLEPFASDLKQISSLGVHGTKVIPFAIENNFSIEENMTLALSVMLENEEEILKNPSGTKIAPAYVWQIDGVTIVLNKMAWYFYVLWAVGTLVLLGAIYYFKRYKNPLVQQLSKTPKDLLTLNPTLLLEAQEKLSTINRWESIRESAEVTQKQFDETVSFFQGDKEQKVTLFCERVGATYSYEEPFYRVHLPKQFNLNMDTFLLCFSDEEPTTIKHKVIGLDDKVLVIGKQEHQASLFKMASDKTNRVIAPTTAKLTEFLMSNRSEAVLIGIFSECLLFKDISPYQVNSGVSNESNFFGRVEIIRDIVTKESTKVNCYSFTMEDENIVLAMSMALDMPKESGLEEVLEQIKSLFF